MKKRIISIVVILVVIIVSGVIGYSIGIKNHQRNEITFYEAILENNIVSFYANILETTDDSIHIAGVPVNDVNHRGEFFIYLASSTYEIKDQQGKKASLEDLVVGTSIRITTGGDVLETYPAQINTVYLIQIMD